MSIFLPEPEELQKVIQVSKSAKVSQLCDLPRGSTKGAIVLCVIRNELHRLPKFFAHHRKLGFERFVFIDNGSDDGTLEFLLRECDTGVFVTSEPFHWIAKHGWIMQVIERLGRNRWYALLDADEHLVFPHCEKRTIQEFISAIQDRGMTRARACLIDMYSEAPVFADRVEQQGFADEYAFFDAQGYSEHRNGHLTVRTGGPRYRMAKSLGRKQRPALTKYPLFKLSNDETAFNPHAIWPPLETREDPCFLALKHFKFDAALSRKIEYALKTGVYWNQSSEYVLYQEWKEKHPQESLHYSGSALYKCSGDFLASRLIDEMVELAGKPSTNSMLARARAIGRASQFKESL